MGGGSRLAAASCDGAALTVFGDPMSLVLGASHNAPRLLRKAAGLDAAARRRIAVAFARRQAQTQQATHTGTQDASSFGFRGELANWFERYGLCRAVASCPRWSTAARSGVAAGGRCAAGGTCDRPWLCLQCSIGPGADARTHCQRPSYGHAPRGSGRVLDLAQPAGAMARSGDDRRTQSGLSRDGCRFTGLVGAACGCLACRTE